MRQKNNHNGILSFENVSKSFNGLKVLNNVTFDVNLGKVIGLVGPNGAGKTTLFNVICGYIRPDQGEIYYDGKVINGLNPHKIASLGISRTFQDVRILNEFSVLENVLLFVPDITGESPQGAIFLPKKKWEEEQHINHVMNALKKVELDDKADWLASELSYAEQKRVLIARLMASTGELLLLDEIASGLDRLQIKTILTFINELKKLGKTLLVIEHNLDIIKNISDEILFLNQGTLIASGKPNELLNDQKLIDIYFGKGGSVQGA